MNGAYLCFTFIHHKPGFPGWLSCTAQVVLFFFCLEKQHLFCHYDYRTEIFRFRARYLAQTTSLVDLYKGLNLEADKADLNGPDISGRPGLGTPHLQILHLRTAACIAYCAARSINYFSITAGRRSFESPETSTGDIHLSL